jgi:hypothetical protein
LPQISTLDEVSINKLIAERIVYPLCDEVGAGVFNLDPGLVIGMFYVSVILSPRLCRVEGSGALA